MNDLPHCAALARRLGERPSGTAPMIRSVLLIEHSGPWSVDVRDKVAAQAFGPGGPSRLEALHRELGLRVLVIRRPGRHQPARRPAVYLGGCRPGHRWLERLSVGDYGELSDVDLTRVAGAPRHPGLGEPVTHPLLLICSHGRKDACCAIRGRPVADALARVHPEATWQCTHFGGDRWAGNMLVAPHGFAYGQLDPESALPVAASTFAGQVSLDHLRGRTGIDPFSQVAEIAVREKAGLAGLDDVLADPPRIVEDGTEGQVSASVQVHAGGALFRVLLSRRPLGMCVHSICEGQTHPQTFDVLGIEAAVHA